MLTTFGFGADGGVSGSIAFGSVAFGISMSAGVLAAKACRNDVAGIVSVAGGSNEACAAMMTASLSFLLSLFETGPSATAEAIAIAGPADGTLARPRMLAAAAPTTSKHVSAMMVMALVKPFSVYFARPPTFPITGR